ncbi:MAG: Gfo/Idh/MocA family oxidoreductase [Vampirovibrionales bacterium]|nr:Gfo/Idh/MocA family oxidoreductase [Vampirovibrionales bacterium]
MTFSPDSFDNLHEQLNQIEEWTPVHPAHDDGRPMPPEKVAVIGCGNWGKNLARNFYNLGFLHAICDMSRERLEAIKSQYKNIYLLSDYQKILDNPEITAVVISTPSHTHYPLAKQALDAGKHVYVEKPIATNTQHTLELFTLAQEKGLTLMVGHLLLYHPAVNRLKQLIAEGVLGQLKNVQSDRLNTNELRPDKSVLWDLAPHDISMMSYIIGDEPDEIVSAVGYRNRDDGLVDDAHIDLVYPHEIGGHIHISWVHPIKQVKLVVRGTEGTALIDDTQGTNKLHVFSKSDELQRVEEFPEYLSIEPLKLECQHFINCIRYGKPPKTDGMNGYKVVKVLEEAEAKMELISV